MRTGVIYIFFDYLINCFYVFCSDFFKAGNYLAAISAYSHGIKISNEMAALYVNRSAAHYALGNYYRCIDDCSKVVEVLIDTRIFKIFYLEIPFKSDRKDI